MANSLQASTEGLAIVDRARQRRGWTKTNTARWWQEAHTSKATLRRFWQQERIQQEIFIALCAVVGISDWQAIAQTPESLAELATETPTAPPPILDLDEAPDIERFYGRQQELTQLTEWIEPERCKLVTLLGMGGMGKTALVLALIEQLTAGETAVAPFEFVLWRSLQTAPTLQTLLDRLLYRLAPNPMQTIAEDVAQGTAQLLGYLRQHRCLLVLDGFDSLLQRQQSDTASRYRPGYEAYGEFLQRLSGDRHQSCILLTSREPCVDIGSQERLRTLTLQGLPALDALALLKAKGMTAKEQELKSLLRLYGGNPLALNLIAPMIQTWFGGNVAGYLSQNTLLLGDRLRNVLRQQLDKLSALEQEIVAWLAIWQEPISLSRLQTHLLCPPGIATMLDSIARLEGRSLLEKHFSENAFSEHSVPELRLTLPPLVMQAASEVLVESAVQEIGQVRQSQDIRQFKLLRTHCLCRPGTDDFVGDRLLTQLVDHLRRSQGDALGWGELFSLLSGQPPIALGYTHHNLLALSRLYGVPESRLVQ